MKITPTWPNIVVEKPKRNETETTAGGIIIPSKEEGENQAEEGIVYAIYDEYECPVEVGQTVFFKRYAGDVMKLEGKDLVLLPINDLLAKEE